MWAFTTNQSEPERYYQDPWTALQNALPDAQYVWKDGEYREASIVFVRFNALMVSRVFDLQDHENVEQALNWSLVHPQTARSVLGVARHASCALMDWPENYARKEMLREALGAFDEPEAC